MRTGAFGFPRVDHFEAVNGVLVGGATEKDILLDPDTGAKFIAKLGGRNSDLEVATEYAIYLVGRTLGIELADALVAEYKGRLRFLSRYFLTDTEELVHGLQLFNELYDESTISGVIGHQSREQEMFSIQAIKTAFGAHYMEYGADVEDQLFSGFVAMLTHDALIGVQDRHHENWGVIVVRRVSGVSPRFAPLYDSARGLFCNRTDGELRRDFTGAAGQAKLDSYVSKARPLVGFKGLKAQHPRRFVSHGELLAALFEAYPAQRQQIRAILDAYDWRMLQHDLRTKLRGLFCPHRVALVLACLRRRMRLLNRAMNARFQSADILS